MMEPILAAWDLLTVAVYAGVGVWAVRILWQTDGCLAVVVGCGMASVSLNTLAQFVGRFT